MFAEISGNFRKLPEISENINKMGIMIQELVMPLIYPLSVPKLRNDQ